VKLRGKSVKVVGVVADFNVSSIMLNNKIGPLIMEKSSKAEVRYLAVSGHNKQVHQLNNKLKTYWHELYPDKLYAGFFQEKVMKPLRTTNKITISINSFVVLVSMIISIIGLYTLVSLTAIRRKKEFGVRKVLGGSSLSIANQLWKEFRWVLIVAAAIGLIVGKLVISNLLDIIFAYHIEVTWPYFLYPIAFMVLILLFCIGYKIWKTARVNPCEQLRAE
ncbi:MAG: ABC transporter permease, partial [Bacteroidota bacterium]